MVSLSQNLPFPITKGRIPAKVVAASNAPDYVRASADYICDGTADEAQINAALTEVGVGGTLLLSQGTFTTTSSILLLDGQQIEGMGQPSNSLTTPFLPTSGQATVINYTSATNYAFQLTSVNHVQIKNVYCLAPNTTGGVFGLTSCETCKISNIQIRNVPNGSGYALLGSSFFNRLENFQFRTSLNKAIYITGNANNANSFIDGEISGGGVGIGIHGDDNSLNNTFVNVVVEPTSTTAHVSDNSGGFIFIDCWFENPAGTSGYFVGSSKFSNCNFPLADLPDLTDLFRTTSYNTVPDPLFLTNGTYPSSFTLVSGTFSSTAQDTDVPIFAMTENGILGYSWRGTVSGGQSSAAIRYRITNATVLTNIAGRTFNVGAYCKGSGGSVARIVARATAPSGNTTNTGINYKSGEWRFVRSYLTAPSDVDGIEIWLQIVGDGATGRFYNPILTIASRDTQLLKPIDYSGGTIRGSLTLQQDDGIDINPGSDTNVDVITLGVTGTPQVTWDEGNDRWDINNDLHVQGIVTSNVFSGGSNIVTRVVNKEGIPDNTATDICTITTTNETGTSDGGAYTVFIQGVVSGYGTTQFGETSPALKGIMASFSHGNDDTGAAINSAVSEIFESASVEENAVTRAIGTVTLSVVATSNYVTTLQILVDSTGNAATHNIAATLEIKVIYTGYVSRPVITGV